MANCGKTGRPACHFVGPFAAGDATTARVVCPRGSRRGTSAFGQKGSGVRSRTLTCPDGASLIMRVRLVLGGGLTGDSTTNFGWEWVITGGTGRLAHLRGSGTTFEPRDA